MPTLSTLCNYGETRLFCVSDDNRSLVDIKRRALENAIAALKEMAHAQKNATTGGRRITITSHCLFSFLQQVILPRKPKCISIRFFKL